MSNTDFTDAQRAAIASITKALARTKAAGVPLSAFAGGAVVAFPTKEQSLALDAAGRALKRASSVQLEIRVTAEFPLVVNLARTEVAPHQIAY